MKQDRIKIIHLKKLDLQSFSELNLVFPGPEVGIAQVKMVSSSVLLFT